jgi:transposase
VAEADGDDRAERVSLPASRHCAKRCHFTQWARRSCTLLRTAIARRHRPNGRRRIRLRNGTAA